MLTRAALLCLCLCLLPSVAMAQASTQALSSDPGSQLKSVHLFSLTFDVEEALLINALQSLNEAVAEVGYPEFGYRLWEVSIGDDGTFTHLLEGTWPNQETYDEIHRAEVFRQTAARLAPLMESLVVGREYIRYSEIQLGRSGTE
jgi:hypothetical protein